MGIKRRTIGILVGIIVLFFEKKVMIFVDRIVSLYSLQLDADLKTIGDMNG